MDYTNLPINEDKIGSIKGDLYAAFYAGGDYPFRSDYKMYGEAVLENGMKTVKDTDAMSFIKLYITVKRFA